MKKALISFAVAAISFVTPAFAEVSSYDVVKHKSLVRFFAIQNGAPVEGRFDEYTMDIKFSPDDVENSKIVVEIDMASLRTAREDVSTNLKLPEWLSTELFPKAKFVSKKINRTPSTNNYYADGDLTLRGKTMPVTINFQMEDLINKDFALAKGSATLHRLDFGVGQGEWADDKVIKNEVRVDFRIVAKKQ
ncbi:MAG: YceI family protein [Rickettsiales bacterium]